MMTTLLERAFARAAQLPESEQDDLASRLLAEMEAEDAFDAKIGRTAHKLVGLANEAIAEHRAGLTRETGPRLPMISRTTRRFRDLMASLPGQVRTQAKQSYRLFRQNPGHPGLRFKVAHADSPIYSARVGIGYRALGALDGDTILSFWIGPYGEYDRVVDQL